MKQNNKLWFTLVELLVVITILAIISVVAYQNFGWAVDKAVWWRKISDVSTIETALQQYKSDNNFYPSVDTYSWTLNVWWYNSWTWALPSNMIKVVYNGEEISKINTWASVGWGKIYWSGTLWQIWAKWTISQEKLTKKYLSKDLYDPEIWDIKVVTGSVTTKMIDYWIWRYVYSVYKKSTWWNWVTNKTWTNYNLAYTIKKDWSDSYVTKVVWDYDSESCYTDKDKCPGTLIWSLSGSLINDYLINWQEIWKTRTWVVIPTYTSDKNIQWVPYSVSDFAQ